MHHSEFSQCAAARASPPMQLSEEVEGVRSSMDVDVPLACKLDVIAGPCSGRAYTNTEDVLEVRAGGLYFATVCLRIRLVVGAGSRKAWLGWAGGILDCSRLLTICLLQHLLNAPLPCPCTPADCDRAQPDSSHAAERWGGVGAARRCALELGGQVLEGERRVLACWFGHPCGGVGSDTFACWLLGSWLPAGRNFMVEGWAR